MKRLYTRPVDQTDPKELGHRRFKQLYLICEQMERTVIEEPPVRCEKNESYTVKGGRATRHIDTKLFGSQLSFLFQVTTKTNVDLRSIRTNSVVYKQLLSSGHSLVTKHCTCICNRTLENRRYDCANVLMYTPSRAISVGQFGTSMHRKHSRRYWHTPCSTMSASLRQNYSRNPQKA